MTSRDLLWAIFWVCVGISVSTAAVSVGRHDGCLAICTNIATAGAN